MKKKETVRIGNREVSAAELMALIAERVAGRKLYQHYSKLYDHSRPFGGENYGVYDWQKEWHDAGARYRERALIAANRVGKSATAAGEVAMHMTGWYPDWWTGRRFTKPVKVWTGAVTNEASRDIIQEALLGPLGKHGTGWIPKEALAKVSMRQAGVPDVVDTIRVKHAAGGESVCNLKTYDQKREKFQGAAIDIWWPDEECPAEIYTEGLTRILDRDGMAIVTFTPLMGATWIVDRFMKAGPESTLYYKNVTWDDAPHLDEKAKADLLSGYAEFERDTRTKGIPMMGEGVVYPVKDEDIHVDPFDLPAHFYRLNGIDFGIATDHPQACVYMAWDKDADTLYVYDSYKKSHETPVYHAHAIKKHGDWIPVAWPHDGVNRDKGSGKALKDQYREHGVRMCSDSARYDDEKGGPQPSEPAVIEILERMRTGRFKVFKTCRDWFEEKRMFHRKDGLIVSKKDDLMKATLYAVMHKRKAAVKTFAGTIRQKYAGPVIGARA